MDRVGCWIFKFGDKGMQFDVYLFSIEDKLWFLEIPKKRVKHVKFSSFLKHLLDSDGGQRRCPHHHPHLSPKSVESERIRAITPQDPGL